MDEHKSTHVLMTGGGTLGPVTPLLAIVEAWRRIDPGVRVTWIGTPHGPEAELLDELHIPFIPMASAKFDRARLWTLPWNAVVFVWSCARAYTLLKHLQPNMIFTAGGYVSVPLVIVGRLMKIPAWVHQLDVRPGLANKLMAPFAKRVSVTWERTAKYFSAKKTIVVGGMERSGLRIGDGNALLQSLGMSPACPTILVMGGGTGARTINETIRAIIPELPEVNVIHLTGKGKNSGVGAPGAHHHYFATEFFTHEMGDAYAAADVVVARAGMGTILEVAALGKPTIFIPIENSDQLANAKMLYNLNAAIIIDHLTPQLLRQEIDRLLKDGLLRRRLSQNISNIFPFGAEERIVEEARKII